jgi:beta-N-acetylhexosaminidase
VRHTLRRAGQRIAVSFRGLAPSAELRHLVQAYGVGSVVLRPPRLEEPEVVTEAVRELQMLARQSDHDVPLLVALEPDGGAPAVEVWTPWPSPGALGRAGSEELARRAGEAQAAELAACGLRLMLAPVLDVETRSGGRNGERFLGDDPDLVGRLGGAWIHGAQAAKVAAAARPFPGMGDLAAETHANDEPAIDQPPSRLQDVELRPFRKAVEAGVPAVQMAGAFYREIDEERPAFLQPHLLGWLRRDLAYAGVVVSADVAAPWLTRRASPAQIAARAAVAGCDLVLVEGTADAQVEAVEGLVRAQEATEIAWAAMDTALGRIRRLKEAVLLPYADPDPRRARQAVGLPPARALADEIIGRAGTRA